MTGCNRTNQLFCWKKYTLTRASEHEFHVHTWKTKEEDEYGQHDSHGTGHLVVEQTKNNIRSYLKRTLKTYYILGKTVITEKKKNVHWAVYFFIYFWLTFSTYSLKMQGNRSNFTCNCKRSFSWLLTEFSTATMYSVFLKTSDHYV